MKTEKYMVYKNMAARQDLIIWRRSSFIIFFIVLLRLTIRVIHQKYMKKVVLLPSATAICVKKNNGMEQIQTA